MRNERGGPRAVLVVAGAIALLVSAFLFAYRREITLYFKGFENPGVNPPERGGADSRTSFYGADDAVTVSVAGIAPSSAGTSTSA